MKRALILALVLALCLTGSAMAEEKSPLEGGEATPLYRSGDYLFELREDGTAKIVSYVLEKIVDPLFGELNPAPEVLEIPSELDGIAVTALGSLAFRQCEMKSVVIPDSVTAVEANPFANCALLDDIRVSQDHPTLAVIDGVLFSKADKRLICYPKGLQRATYAVPRGIELIDEWAFSQNEALTGVTIPDSVTSIGAYAFARCERLAELAIPGSVTAVGNYAFAWCYRLTKAAVPDSVTALGANPFAYCASLAEIAVSPDHPALAVIDGVLFEKESMRLVCYPEGLGAADYALPEGAASIGEGAFSANIRLQRVTIPESVTAVGSRAFALCAGLTQVVVPQSVTSIGDEAFYACERVTLVVPRGSFAAQYAMDGGISYTYQDANSWLND